MSEKATAEELASRLPVWMPKDSHSGNYRLLEPIANELDSTEGDLGAVDRALTVQTADSIEQLEELAKLVGLYHMKDESLEHFRARILAEYQLVTSNGTVADLINGIATILGIDEELVEYTEQHTTAAGNCRVSVPRRRLDQFQLTYAEFGEIVESLIPASYRIDVFQKGTFNYITPAEYNANSSQAEFGYDGLDTNGDPKDSGGTYATVL